MLTGKTALVTGATGGVGPAVVQALAEAGASLAVTARGKDGLLRLAEQIPLPPDRWLAHPVDLTEAIAVQTLANTVADRFGGIDILVAVAGGWRGGVPVVDTKLETLDWLWRTNVVTAFNVARAVLPFMLDRGWGRIVTFAARSALGGQARSGAYAAGKAAVLALTQSIAAETKGQGITANTVLISTADTPANRASMPNVDPDRWVPPDKIASAVVFLCSDAAAAITGAAIPL